MPKSVFFITLGCKVNQYDSEAMLEQFELKGYVAAPNAQAADVVVVNTCTVTATGDKKSMQMVRRYGKNACELIIAGCYAQRMGEKLLETGARLIIGNQYRHQVVELLEKAISENQQLVAVDKVEGIPYEKLFIHSHEGFTRAVMKIQEGCDNHCTYCIIPNVRGSIRSRELADIRSEAENLAQAGYQELVLTGIHLTSYGRDLNKSTHLADAVQAAGIHGIRRIRLGSLEPRVVTGDFVEKLSKIPEFCPQFHLALQSGSDSVLNRMKRCYSTKQFSEAVDRLRAVWPNCAFTTDVIVGFPGETEEEFGQTLDFCEKIGFARLHVFPFSPREGTPAAGMPHQIPTQIKNERVRRLIALGDMLASRYRQGFIGRETEVLFEELREDGTVGGYTPEYIYVTAPNGCPKQIQSLRLTGLSDEGMTGEILSNYIEQEDLS